MAGNPDITAVAVAPVAGNPAGIAARRGGIMAGHPDIAASIPAIISGLPYPAAMHGAGTISRGAGGGGPMWTYTWAEAIKLDASMAVDTRTRSRFFIIPPVHDCQVSCDSRWSYESVQGTTAHEFLNTEGREQLRWSRLFIFFGRGKRESLTDGWR